MAVEAPGGAGLSAAQRGPKVSCFSQKTRQRRVDTPDDAACETENGVHDLGRRPEQTGDACGWVAARRGAAKSAENGCQRSDWQRLAALKAASTSQGRTMPSRSHVEAARLGPRLCGRACESKSDACTHPCFASRGRSTTLRDLSDAPLKRAASALDRFEKRPTLRPGARPQLSSRAPFLSHGQPVRRRRVGRARDDQPTSAATPHGSSVQRVLSPAPLQAAMTAQPRLATVAPLPGPLGRAARLAAALVLQGAAASAKWRAKHKSYALAASPRFARRQGIPL